MTWGTVSIAKMKREAAGRIAACFLENLSKMLQSAAAAGGDHRDRYRLSDRTGHFQVKAGLGAVRHPWCKEVSPAPRASPC